LRADHIANEEVGADPIKLNRIRIKIYSWSMIFSDLPWPAEAVLNESFATGWLREGGKSEVHPRIKSEGRLFPDHALLELILHLRDTRYSASLVAA
jgi:hypothetical protein